MKKNLAKYLSALLVASVVGFASQALAADQTKTAVTAPAHHGHEFKGSVTAYDETAKMLKLKDSAGKEKDFTLTTATALHGTVKVGEKATVRYMVKDGKDVATSVSVGAPAQAPAKAPAAAPATTPK